MSEPTEREALADKIFKFLGVMATAQCKSDLVTLLYQNGVFISGLLPIESAPRDGTEIDVWVTSECAGKPSCYRLPKCKWRDGEWYHYSLDNSAGYGELDWVPVYEQNKITHWQPLPLPPAKSQEV